LVERSAGKVLHHDGGLEHSAALLPGIVSRADVSLFPVDCVSHDAVTAIERACRQVARPYRPLRTEPRVPVNGVGCIRQSVARPQDRALLGLGDARLVLAAGRLVAARPRSKTLTKTSGRNSIAATGRFPPQPGARPGKIRLPRDRQVRLDLAGRVTTLDGKDGKMSMQARPRRCRLNNKVANGNKFPSNGECRTRRVAPHARSLAVGAQSAHLWNMIPKDGYRSSEKIMLQ
jgi:hypothetical protein